MDTLFFNKSMKIAVPVALQAMLQSSFSMIDQVMVGQLGKTQIAAVEIGGKPGFVFTFVMGAVATVAGIQVSQYIGKKDEKSVSVSMSLNMCVMLMIAFATTFLCLLMPTTLAAVFCGDSAVITQAKGYIRLVALAYPLAGISSILAVQIRCLDYAKYPLLASGVSAVINTALNWIFIFGKMGMPAMGVKGAALASVISKAVELVIMILIFKKLCTFKFDIRMDRAGYVQYLIILVPIVLNELLWTMGQNVNTFIYGHMGTNELAGMSLTGPVQGMFIGALSGLSQAAGILIGKRLGEKKYDKAYDESVKLCIYGFAGSVALSLILLSVRNYYTGFYNVGSQVRNVGGNLLIAFAVLAPVKVANMILGGGIIRSGGRTKYIMIIDILGTWLVGVPLGLYTGLVLKLPIVWVYFILSQEEVVRLIISIIMFRGRKWMNTIA